MRVAMDHAIEIERHVPGAEHVVSDAIAQFEVAMGLDEGDQRHALEPGHAQQAAGGKIFQGFGHLDAGLLGQHGAIEAHVFGLLAVIQFLAQARGDLGMDVFGDDGSVVAFVDGEDQAQLLEIGLHRRLHVGILQLAGEKAPAMGCCAMDLAQARRRGGFFLECREAALPIGA